MADYPEENKEMTRLTSPGLAKRIYNAGRVVGGAAAVYEQGAEDFGRMAKRSFINHMSGRKKDLPQ